MSFTARAALVLTPWIFGCATTRVTANTAATAAPPVNYGPAVTWRGDVRFEARHPTLQGASRDVELRPARYVEVLALGPGDIELAHAFTGADGAFSLSAPRGIAALAVRAHVSYDGVEVSVSPQSDGQSLHTMRVPVTSPDAPLHVTASDANPAGYAGAFHIADTVLRGLHAVKTWTGQTLPPLIVYWGRGVTTEWSYYRGERPPRSNRFFLELLGGRPGQQSTSDTDEHDEGIILHEVGHFVMDRLSSSSSAGGTHPSGHLIDPGLAWEEGRATWFSSAVRREPHYQDTIGIEPGGSLRVNHDLEHRTDNNPRGVGSEESVADILWDLCDGADNAPDDDHDGVALGPAAVLRAMMSAHDDAAAYPSLATFLRGLSAGEHPTVAPDAMRAMLTTTGEPMSLLAEGAEAWPTDIALPGNVTGKVDGLTNPAPSGGRPMPESGMDAVRVYRVHLAQRGWLHLELVIEGTGRPQDHSDVDMELHDHRGELIAASRGTAERETVGRLLDPGYFYVYVRDGGSGNRAGFQLRARTTPVR